MNTWPVKHWILRVIVAGFATALVWEATNWILGVLVLAEAISLTWWQLGRAQEREEEADDPR